MPTKPKLQIFCGPPAGGKSTKLFAHIQPLWAQHIYPTLIMADAVAGLTTLAGIPVYILPDGSAVNWAYTAFPPSHQTYVDNRIQELLEQALRAPQATYIFLEAPLLTPAARAPIFKTAVAAYPPPEITVRWFSAPLPTLIRRNSQRHSPIPERRLIEMAAAAIQPTQSESASAHFL